MTDSIIQLLREVRPVEAERTREVFPWEHRARELARILGEDRAARVSAVPSLGGHRRVRRGAWSLRAGRRPVVLSALGAVVAAAAAVIVLMSGSAGVPTSAAVAFESMPGGTIVARVREPFAAQRELNAAFAARGYQITVDLVPASPSLVGSMVAVGAQEPQSVIEPLQAGPCLTGGGQCGIGVRIPASFTGKASIILGRPARPGERYESGTSAFAAGEALHCSGLIGDTVAEAMPVLTAEKLTVVWGTVEEVSGHSVSQRVSNPPTGAYIWDGDMIEAGKVSLTIHSAPPSSDPNLLTHDERLADGCPTSGTGQGAHSGS